MGRGRFRHLDLGSPQGSSQELVFMGSVRELVITECYSALGKYERHSICPQKDHYSEAGKHQSARSGAFQFMLRCRQETQRKPDCHPWYLKISPQDQMLNGDGPKCLLEAPRKL